MVELNVVLILIDSIAIFFQGFSFRRRHTLILWISSIIMMFISVLGITLNGVSIYVDALSNVNRYDAISSLAYVLFWWISGYIIGGFQKVPSYIKIAKTKLDEGELKWDEGELKLNKGKIKVEKVEEHGNSKM